MNGAAINQNKHVPIFHVMFTTPILVATRKSKGTSKYSCHPFSSTLPILKMAITAIRHNFFGESDMCSALLYASDVAF